MSTNKRNARRYRNNKDDESKRREYTEKDNKVPSRRGGNDLSWHAKSETLLTEASSIPWSWATGRPITLGGPDFCAPDVTFKYTMPGIFALRTVITPGTGMVASDALNIASQAIYTDIRRMLKSANNYEASDVMIYLTSVAEVIAYIGWLTRLYATTMMYSYKNTYLPDALIRMQGVNPSDLHNHALEFLSRANQLIAKASQIYIPKGFDFIDRCRWEYANYYSEGESIKDQIYMITPGLFRKFQMVASQDYKGSLIPSFVIKPNSNYSVNVLLDRLEEMIEALIGDSDFNNIAGDLMNRYGEAGVVTFSLIPQDAVMQIISGPAAFEVLEQIQNARALNGVFTEWAKLQPNEYGAPTAQVDMFKVMQGSESLQNQYLTVKAFVASQDTSNAEKRGLFIADAIDSLLTVHDNPNAAKTMLITRFQNMIYGCEDALTEVSYWVEAAADFVVSFEMCKLNTDGTYQASAFLSARNGASAAVDEAYMKTRPFHYWPTTYLTDGNQVEDISSAMDVIAPITVTQLRDINRVDLMSLFAVPDIGKLTNAK